jgi:hypothetical protein
MLTIGPRIDPDLTCPRPDRDPAPPLVDPRAGEAAWLVAAGLAVVAAAAAVIGCIRLGVELFKGI